MSGKSAKKAKNTVFSPDIKNDIWSNNPDTQPFSQCTSFINDLSALAQKYHIKKVSYSILGVSNLEFEDGTRVGTVRALKESGLI